MARDFRFVFFDPMQPNFFSGLWIREHNQCVMQSGVVDGREKLEVRRDHAVQSRPEREKVLVMDFVVQMVVRRSCSLERNLMTASAGEPSGIDSSLCRASWLEGPIVTVSMTEKGVYRGTPKGGGAP